MGGRRRALIGAAVVVISVDVVAIVEGRPGPLVDGRPYHVPEFVQELEAYHALAAVAHRTHGGADLSMPPVPVLPPAEGDRAADLSDLDGLPETEPMPAASWGFHQDTSVDPDEER